MALLRYAVEGVFRNRRRTLSSILGVLLAVAFVSGTLIAIDSSARATLDAYLSNLSEDFLFVFPYGNATELREKIMAIPGVKDLSMVSFVAGVVGSPSVPPPENTTSFVYGIEPDHLSVSLGLVRLMAGSLDLPRGTTALTVDLASILEVNLGDTVYFENREYNRTTQSLDIFRLNVTVTALFNVTWPTDRPGPSSPYSPTYGALIDIRDAGWAHEQLRYSFSSDIQGQVLVDRDRLIDPYDMQESQRNTARIGRQLMQVGGTDQVYDRLSDFLNSFSMQILFQRVFYLFLSTPVLLLGTYLGIVGVDLGHAERRRELAVLKTRGAGRTQIVGLLILEATVGGLVAALFGLVLGIGVSRLLLAYVNPFAAQVAPRYDVLQLSPTTITAVVILSIAFMAGVSYNSSKRAAGLPIVETLRYYTPGETKLVHKRGTDIFLVVFALTVYFGAWFGMTSGGDIGSYLIGGIFTTLLPLAPILLVFGATRLLTMSTSRVYSAMSRVTKPFTKDLHHVVSRNLSRNPRRSANVAVIIALGLSFGFFVFSFYSSQQAYQTRVLRASIGADMSIEEPESYDPTFVQNISAVSGVVGVTRVTRCGGCTVSAGVASIYALEPGTYFAVTQPEWWYFKTSSPEEAQRMLSSKGSVLISQSYFDSAFLAIGDRLTMHAEVFNETTGSYESREIDVRIAGVVGGLPGLVPSMWPENFIYASLETLDPLMRSGIPESRVLARLQQGADWRTVLGRVYELGGRNVRVLQSELERVWQEPFSRALYGFIAMEISFMVVILTAGIGLIIYASSLERDVEFAGIIARGASGWQAAALLVGEAVSVMLIGLIVGMGVGLGTAFVAITVLFSAFTYGPAPVVPMLFEFPVSALLLAVLTPLAIVVTALLISWRVARMDIAKVLKLRGG